MTFLNVPPPPPPIPIEPDSVFWLLYGLILREQNTTNWRIPVKTKNTPAWLLLTRGCLFLLSLFLFLFVCLFCFVFSSNWKELKACYRQPVKSMWKNKRQNSRSQIVCIWILKISVEKRVHYVGVVLTLVSMDEIVRCRHSNESYWAVHSWDAVYYAVQVGSIFWICGWNPKVWPFKWKLLSGTFLWCSLLSCTSWL